MGKYLVVGGDPLVAAQIHPGGVVTLTQGVLDYARHHGHQVVIVNTARSGFIKTPFLEDLSAGLKRMREVFSHLWTRQFSGVIIFSGGGFGYFERTLMSLCCRVLGTKDVFIIVAGVFMTIREANWLHRSVVRLMLKIPHRIVSSGSNWGRLFDELGVPPCRRLPMRYWRASDFPVANQPRSGPHGRPVQMLYVGWLIADKGVGELLSAITLLRRYYEFRFVFVGGGTLLELVRQVIADNHWEYSVAALGWISDMELQHQMDEADVFVLPSYAEGFPMSLIEAFSRGLPAIVSDVGSVADSLHDGDNGFLIRPRSVMSLAAAMRRYLDDPGQIHEHSRKALEVVTTNHAADTNCEILFDAFE